MTTVYDFVFSFFTSLSYSFQWFCQLLYGPCRSKQQKKKQNNKENWMYFMHITMNLLLNSYYNYFHHFIDVYSHMSDYLYINSITKIYFVCCLVTKIEAFSSEWRCAHPTIYINMILNRKTMKKMCFFFVFLEKKNISFYFYHYIKVMNELIKTRSIVWSNMNIEYCCGIVNFSF